MLRCQTALKQELMTDDEMQFLTSCAKVIEPSCVSHEFAVRDETIGSLITALYNQLTE